MELSGSLYYTLKRYGLPTHDKSMAYNFSVRPDKPLTKEEIEYAKNDVAYLLMLKAMQESRLSKLQLTKLATLENKVVEVLVRMRDAGVGVDVKRWLEVEKENTKKVAPAKKAVKKAASGEPKKRSIYGFGLDLLELLKKGGSHPMDSLTKKFKVKNNDVSFQIAAIKSNGYKVERTDKGYKLVK